MPTNPQTQNPQQSLRQIALPSLGRFLSNLMAAPSSAEATTHEAGLSAYHRLGGNGIHLHGEGGETHSKRATGNWLRSHRLRSTFFLCTQICHDEWDETARQPILRFTPEAVREDIAADLEQIGTDYLDLVYLDDRPSLPFEPVLDAIFQEISCGRVRALGVRNWTAERIRAAHTYALSVSAPGIAALVTTELSLLATTRPLWPDYAPFDADLERVIRELGLAVFAHADDLTQGQCLFGEEDPVARMRPEWVERWRHPANAALAHRIRDFADAQGLTPREVCLAWLLNRPFPVLAVIGLPSLLTERRVPYERVPWLRLDDVESCI